MGEDCLHAIPLGRRVLQDAAAVRRGQITGGKHILQGLLPEGRDGRGGQQPGPGPGAPGVRRQKGPEGRRLVLPVDVHQGQGFFLNGGGPVPEVAQGLAALHQLIAPLSMGPGNALAGEGRAAGDVEEVAVDVVLHALEVVGGDLPGHVEGDPALQAQHQLREGPVQVVDHVEVQALFQQHGKAEHVLLFEVLVLGHIVHGHVAAEEHRVQRPPQHRGLQKVQFPGAHFLQSVVGLAQRQLEGGGGDLQLVKMDGADVLTQVEGVQLL